ncbi:unnamed protein product [Candidula unifasciata]|uniref:C2H2-type domain-containing protein n=1 Tax=Candidula unifasciata TaxID=100452 RepID=A0A8S4A737_9EUPU|nr:unnamed protein product [Candidula unifasciata]
MKPLEAIRCTYPRCPCECFAPGRQSLRFCETCNHGWVAHALDKLGANFGLQMEMVQPNIVFDIASLMLYGAQATPVRLKILLDRLFAELQHQEILQILHGFGWTYEDYARGYILQDKMGHVLDNWYMTTHEEELVVLQQFLRFGETKAIAQEIILQDMKSNHEILKQTQKAGSSIKTFLEHSNQPEQNYTVPYDYAAKCFVTNPFQFVQSASRMIPAPVMPQMCSPTGEPHFMSMLQAPVASSTPVNISPLHRLNVLKHSDLLEQSAVKPNHKGFDGSRIPSCESPQDLSNASSSSSHQSLQIHQKHQDQGSDGKDGSDSQVSGSDDGDVRDYSKSQISNSLAEKGMERHVRKSENPCRREWRESRNFDNTFMGSNGKKRALCTACNKTFCDKGALKIHYSAVHLKEMHKCTVEGCQMMFSSRRSRNRHSANLNPKLHMSQNQASELDHAENDLSEINGLVPLAASSSSANLTFSMADAPSMHLQIPTILNAQNSVSGKSDPVDFLASLRKRIKLEHNQSANVEDHCSDDVPYDLSKKLDNDADQEIDSERSSNDKATVQGAESDESETNNQWVTQGRVLSASVQNGDNDTFTEGRYSLNHDSGQMLRIKTSTIDSIDVANSSNNPQVEKQVKEFQKPGSSHSKDFNEISERKEKRRVPKVTASQGVDSALDTSKSLPNNEELLIADGTCAVSESRRKKEIPAAARNHTEENQLPSGNDALVDKKSKHPYQCKICCKNFTESFFLKIHFEKHHLNYMIPSDIVNRRESPSKKNQTH